MSRDAAQGLNVARRVSTSLDMSGLSVGLELMADLIDTPRILESEGWDDYALLDSGNGLKFERYG